MKINNKFLFFYLCIFIQVILIQFSTHHYETLDWDINTFLVTSLEFGRGDLPYEFQYENKPPLLFLIFFIFSAISQKSLLLIKIINDLIIFLLSISLTRLYGNKSFSLWNLIPGLTFIAFTSNVWFHPNYSEYLLLVFVVASNFIYQKSDSKFKYLYVGILLALSTLVNLGAIVFLLSYILIIYIKEERVRVEYRNLFFGFSFVHLLTGITYFVFGILEEYIMSLVVIPYSYTSSETSFWSAIQVFVQALADFDLFLYGLLVILITFTLFKTVSLIRSLDFNNFTSEIVIQIFASALFFGLSSKGYYHHLIPLLYFLPACLHLLDKRLSKGVIIFFVVFSFIGVNEKLANQSINNIRNLQTLEENYPTKKAYNQIKNQIDNNDIIFSTENILLLYFLDRPNSSYIVHPALYNYPEITSVLESSNKISKKEVIKNLQLLPDVIEGSSFDRSLIDMNIYQEIVFRNINFELLNYWDEGDVTVYIKK
jgi:hypothetical protein